MLLTCSAFQDTAYTTDHSSKAQVLLSAKEAVSLWVLGARKVGFSSVEVADLADNFTLLSMHRNAQANVAKVFSISMLMSEIS